MKKLILVLAIILSFVSLCFGGGWYYSHVEVAAGGTDYTADANCQGAWLFATDHELEDSSGEGNTLTNVGTTTFSSADLPSGYTTGQAAVFNGTSQALKDEEPSANFPGVAASKTNFSVAFWFKTNAENEQGSLLRKGSGAGADNGGWVIDLGWSEAEGDLNAGICESDGAGGTQVSNGLGDADFSSWTHVVFIFTGGTNSAKVYVSQGSFGSVVNGATETYTNVDNVGVDDLGSYFVMAANEWASSEWCAVKIYQPAVFDDALSEAEATEIYTDGITGAD